MTDTDKTSDKTHKPSVCDNQHSELKRLAGALRGCLYITEEEHEAILALIAENERLVAKEHEVMALVAEMAKLQPDLRNDLERAKRNTRERDEAVALLREVEYKVSESVVGRISSFLARIDAAE